ncbi:hypothetical protein CONPUDRAFT_165991 [Coniophora puteana RWD-64-598 SS2]|uniref:Uncharacterized protein n=1 Tax=Coniophora puteana (strain RWD-64-598) TaxID=741705 RepID=A0A5M3MN89_CONPW|nr:uncharacterized protein CONPUDRAFT_165991 [Coniophora puteana RWD-64-598 SS2]EIW80480.1 hypothetical protein CONPUDRAFT_165991 [Coniophora puteana RWD-64-598 SS2]
MAPTDSSLSPAPTAAVSYLNSQSGTSTAVKIVIIIVPVIIVLTLALCCYKAFRRSRALRRPHTKERPSSVLSTSSSFHSAYDPATTSSAGAGAGVGRTPSNAQLFSPVNVPAAVRALRRPRPRDQDGQDAPPPSDSARPESTASLPPYEQYPASYVPCLRDSKSGSAAFAAAAVANASDHSHNRADAAGPRPLPGVPTIQVDDFSERVGTGFGVEVEVEVEVEREFESASGEEDHDERDVSYPPGLEPAPQYPPRAVFNSRPRPA